MTDSGQTRRLRPYDEVSPELEPIAPPGTGTLDVNWSVRLIIEGGDTLSFRIKLSETIMIGRSDPDQGFKPEIDLEPFGGVEKGISRQHAMIMATTESLIIKDLDSTNGTRLNNHALRPGKTYRLRHGDTLIVGHLRLQVEFEMVPIHEGVKVEHKGTGALVPPDSVESVHLHKKHILIVEKDRAVAQLLEELLGKLKLKFHTVSTVAEAMRFIASEVPRAVLLDLAMPDDSGLEVIRMLREDMSARTLPIIVMSRGSSKADIEAALRAGADVFLSKPVGMNELVDALNRFVTHS